MASDFVAGTCRYCLQPFVVRIVPKYRADPPLCCSSACGKRWRNWVVTCKRRERDKHPNSKPSVFVPYSPVEVFLRDGYRCHVCGEITDPAAGPHDPERPTVDHVVPKRDGGADTLDNVRCAHQVCNEARSRHDGRRRRPEPPQVVHVTSDAPMSTLGDLWPPPIPPTPPDAS